MGAWYWIGVSAGFGAAVGVLLAGTLRIALIAVAVVGAVAGVGIGYAVDAWQPGGWVDVVAGAAGGFAAAFGAAQIVRGALRRGGTAAGTALIVAGAAALLAALAWVPALGYVEAVAFPALAVRLRKRHPERYAGLRTLARD